MLSYQVGVEAKYLVLAFLSFFTLCMLPMEGIEDCVDLLAQIGLSWSPIHLVPTILF